MPTKKAAAPVKAAKAIIAVAKPIKRSQEPRPVRQRVAPEDKWLAKQQALLVAARIERVAEAEALKAEADQLAMDAEAGDTRFDEEGGEGSTVAIDRERELALSAHARAEVVEIDEALDKIDDGSYGPCSRCGKPIPKARLEAIPWAAMCVSCKSGGLSARR